MRVFVFFDLPTETAAERRSYRKFRKLLITNGFLMMQESVYCKMVLNGSVMHSVSELIEKNKPSNGLVQLLAVTEKQFASMKFITGELKSDVVDSDERIVIL